MLPTMSPLTVRMTVSEILKRKGMTTAEFAEKANLSYNTALALRRGSSRRIDFKTLARVCEVLDVQPGILFTTEEVEDLETE